MFANKVYLLLLLASTGLFVVIEGWSISGRNIPVEVRYDRPEDVHDYNRVYDLRSMHEPEKAEVKVEKNIQQAEQQVGKEEAEKQEQRKQEPSGEEQVQEKQVAREAVEALPLKQEQQIDTIKTHVKHCGEENLNEKTQLSPEETLSAIKHLPQQPEDPITNEINPDLQNSSQQSTSILSKAQEIIYSGISNIRTRVDAFVSDNEGVPYVGENVWRDLNATVDGMIEALRDEPQQQNQTYLQSIVNRFQAVSNSFLQTIRRNRTAQNEEQPGFGQNIIGFFTGGFQQITGNLTSFSSTSSTTPSSVLSDVEMDSESPNPVQGFINNVQNFFSGPQQQISQAFQPNQSDPETTNQQSGSGNLFQNVGNYFGQVVGVFSSTQAPGSQSEEQPGSQPLQFFQTAFQNVGQAINSNNIFGSRPPGNGTEGDEQSGSSQPVQFFQNVATQVGQIFRPQSNASESDEQTGSQPTQIFQNVANQFGQVFNPFKPDSSSSSPSSQSDTSTQSPPNPIVAGIQNVGNQFQQFVGSQGGGSNPLQGVQNPIQGIQGPNVIQGVTPPNVQNLVSPISDAVSNITPPGGSKGSSEAPKSVLGMLGASKEYAEAEKLDPELRDTTVVSRETTTEAAAEIMIAEESIQKE